MYTHQSQKNKFVEEKELQIMKIQNFKNSTKKHICHIEK